MIEDRKGKRWRLWYVFILLATVPRLYDIYHHWPEVPGYEVEEIAQHLIAGQGFSFSATGWLFGSAAPGPPHPTAWQEPVYPVLLALAFKTLGAYGRLAMLLLQLAALGLTSIVICRLGRKVFDTPTGILAGSLLVLWPSTRYLISGALNVAPLAGLLVALLAGVILWCLEKPSARRGLVLGALLGGMCLTLATTLLFVPTVVLAVLWAQRSLRPAAWKPVLAILLGLGIMVGPWATRNLLVFKQLVPVRTGLGFNAYLVNPPLAETYTPRFQACPGVGGPSWPAADGMAALRRMRKYPERTALYQRALDCIEHHAPAGYEQFNEAERDRVYLQRTWEFACAEPSLFASMVYYRGMDFFFTGWPWYHRIMTLAALLGALITLRNSRARILTLLALAYAVPYTLAAAFFYRYRYPIDPLLLVLASYAFTWSAAKLKQRLWRPAHPLSSFIL